MPNDIAIRVENLGKRYVIGRETPPAPTFAGRLRQTAASPFSWLASQMRGPSEDEILWALKDVSFEVKRGEVLGVIGRNGAGKSTLLKILSRITEPTTGHAEIHGRVGALLEVGTGMHPELTGRENIYLNGTILGMRKTEIDTKFDEIVDFSGIERFLDTPVKRYSSGMRVRLGFAIAAHLEPEILVIDEVLAVGDAEFQRKCLGKMKDVAGHGRTVLFVSHNMAVIESLCQTGICLTQGRISGSGTAKATCKHYFSGSSLSASSSVDLRDSSLHSGTENILTRCRLLGEDGNEKDSFPQGEKIHILIDYDASHVDRMAGVGFIIESATGIRIGGYNTYFAFPPPHRLPKTGTVHFSLNSPILSSGSYSLNISAGVHQNEVIDRVERAIHFDVLQREIHPTSALVPPAIGFVCLDCDAKILGHAT